MKKVAAMVVMMSGMFLSSGLSAAETPKNPSGTTESVVSKCLHSKLVASIKGNPKIAIVTTVGVVSLLAAYKWCTPFRKLLGLDDENVNKNHVID